MLWGSLTVYWHELAGISAIGLIGQRIVWATVVLATFATATRRWGPLMAVARDRRLVARIVAAAALLAVNWTSYVWAVTHDNVVETALGYFIAPLGIVAIGVLLFHEQLRRAQGYALGLAFLAVVVLTIEAGRVPFIALTLGFTWGCYGLLKRTVPLGAMESLTAETIVLLPIALVCVAVVEASDNAVRTNASAGQLALVVGTGIITVIPLTLFAFAAPRVPFTLLGPMQYAVPTINFVLGVIVYDESLPALRVAGFGLVWIALIVFTTDTIRSLRT